MTEINYIPPATKRMIKESGACSRSRDAAGSLLRATQAEIQQLESTGDLTFKQAAQELRDAANYSFPANAEVSHDAERRCDH